MMKFSDAVAQGAAASVSKEYLSRMMPAVEWEVLDRGPYFILVQWRYGKMAGERGVNVEIAGNPTRAGAKLMNAVCIVMLWLADFIMRSSFCYEEVMDAANLCAVSLVTEYNGGVPA